MKNKWSILLTLFTGMIGATAAAEYVITVDSLTVLKADEFTMGKEFTPDGKNYDAKTGKKYNIIRKCQSQFSVNITDEAKNVLLEKLLLCNGEKISNEQAVVLVITETIRSKSNIFVKIAEIDEQKNDILRFKSKYCVEKTAVYRECEVNLAPIEAEFSLNFTGFENVEVEEDVYYPIEVELNLRK
ncbi:MAG: hypothetical protein KAH84_04085 [Thiomargarita sp.]|nr:hypothetical protein [Thiomargarita sp.]